METIDQSTLLAESRKGRGKVIFGFLLSNISGCVYLDTHAVVFSLSLFALGVLLFIWGHIQNTFAKRKVLKQVDVSSNRQTLAASWLGLVVTGLSAFLLFTLAGSNGMAALAPIKQIQEVDSVLKKYHKQPKKGTLTADQRKENLEIKERVLRKDFNLREMARLSLDKQWDKMSATQRNSFVELFTNLLLYNAILHSEKHSGKENISYLSESPIEGLKGKRMEVKTRIEVPSESVDFDVDYAMFLDSKLDRWRVYDLMIDGNSLMENYRDQFDTIIRAKSYNELVRRMQKKLDAKRAQEKKQS